ncbi:MAG TPA: sulfate ABC transporter substrate-binding protein [Gammaproteobacteria bacterium]|nr:sulfate ABC transporter substrate-binding protein [Gammaproteobacteria bacterium]
MKLTMRNLIVAAIATTVMIGAPLLATADDITLLNVSYDPTHELYAEFNAAFAKYWKTKTGDTVTIQLSNGGSGSQSRAIIDGLQADVATLALAADIDALYTEADLIPEDWQNRLPDNSSPYTSTVVLLVRKGNPKHIKDFSDLIKPGVSVITANPKTSGGARWNFLAAWSWALKEYGSESKARQFMAKLYKNVPVLDSGARDSTITFVERGIGDVFIAWENEAFLAIEEMGPGDYQMVIPSQSILAEPPVTVVDEVVDDHDTREVATAYLKYLYTKKGQEIIGKHFYRPRDPQVAAQYKDQFPQIPMTTIADFGGWDKAQAKYFDDGGIFDQIYEEGHY